MLDLDQIFVLQDTLGPKIIFNKFKSDIKLMVQRDPNQQATSKGHILIEMCVHNDNSCMLYFDPW